MKKLTESNEVKFTHPMIMSDTACAFLYAYGFIFLNKYIFMNISYNNLSISTIVGSILMILSNHYFINKIKSNKFNFKILLIMEFIFYIIIYIVLTKTDNVMYYLVGDAIAFNFMTNGITINRKRLINKLFVDEARVSYDLMSRQCSSIATFVSSIMVLLVKPPIVIMYVIILLAISTDNLVMFIILDKVDFDKTSDVVV